MHLITIMTMLVLSLCSVASPASPQEKQTPKTATITEKTQNLSHLPGFVPFYWDDKEGKIWLEVRQFDTEFLYIESLATGLGSNDIGLDRGQLGANLIVKFQRSGPRVLLVQPNYSYRAVSPNLAERRAVEESFAQSVLWGFEVAAEENGSVLVDASPFFLRDAHDVVGRLKGTKQGSYRLEPSRSAFYLPRTKSFPRNTEVEVTLTFLADEPGNYVSQVAPTPNAVTVRQHHSFVQLPDDGYSPRTFDPRAGYFGFSYQDYASPAGEPLTKRYIARHRLKKRNPRAPISEAVQPIVYYVDRGSPEPIRSALMEGPRWWNQAFEAAGFRDAFRVELMPEDADPMDVRYNVIQWVHRATRGWSYGMTVDDPRTGEIIKGQVTLGSLRDRQDYLLAEAWLAPYEDGKPIPAAMEQFALARLRQLAAHEVGHTLGLAHNYISSTMNRASVMDYPHPWIEVKPDGTIDISRAYAVGIGEWDKIAIQYGYQDFPKGTHAEVQLDQLVHDAIKRGLIFLTDQDARPPGSPHPATHLWDNGADAVDELERLMKLRHLALDRFSERAIRQGAPLATLEEVLVPLYLSHRYQVEAAAKVVGGLKYTYALRGDGQAPTTMVPPGQQRRALKALLTAVASENLEIPEKLLRLIPPRPAGYERHRELFLNRTGGTFDPFSAAETVANLTFGLILHPQRAARLVEFAARDTQYLGLGEVIETVLSATWKGGSEAGYRSEIHRAVDIAALYHLMALAADQSAASQARAIALLKLDELAQWLKQTIPETTDSNQQAHYVFGMDQIKRFREDPAKLPLPQPAEGPPGQPIGMLE